ncbi:MAG: 3-deoxy-8-phosphooctulonate synthase [Candidatus Aminicenantes bacterium]|nr:MAG: 3-deoxy-8-phosphooctulonate synthase [Candidatus Aminicenantes bacterium]
MNTKPKEINISDKVKIGGSQPLFLIGGPCVIENEEHALFLATQINLVCNNLGIPYIFKASYDKANRSSVTSYRGPGYPAGLQVLDNIKNTLNIPVLSDVHETSQVDKAAQVLDILQIPAFLCRQTDLLIEAARTGKPVNIKKGPFLAPHDMKNIVEKVLSQENANIILTERGTSFGYNNLVFDVRSIPIMKNLGFPVVIDASHSVQKPGGKGTYSGGDAEFIPHVAAAGIAAGADGIFLEIHDAPLKALSDGPNSLILNNLESFLRTLMRVKNAIQNKESPA